MHLNLKKLSLKGIYISECTERKELCGVIVDLKTKFFAIVYLCI